MANVGACRVYDSFSTAGLEPGEECHESSPQDDDDDSHEDFHDILHITERLFNRSHLDPGVRSEG